MSRYGKQGFAIGALVTAVGLCCYSPTLAGKPGGVGGAGGGKSSALYTHVDLKGFTVTYPGGTLVQSAAAAVNEPDGTGTVQVVGSSIFQLGNYTDYRIHPVLWEVNSDASFTQIDLGLPPQAYQASATDINDLGVITIKVGATSDFSKDSWVSVPGKTLQQLANAGPGTRLRVNNLGEIIGAGVLWQLTEGIPGDSIILSGFKSAGIADTGLMAGHDGHNYDFGENPWKDYGTDGVPTLAWFKADGSLHVESIPQPDTPDGFLLHGSATTISPNGEWVAGYVVDTFRIAAQAFVWSDATGMILLDRLGGADCMAVDVNNSGEVVGWSDTGDRNYPVSACVWKDGQVFDLNVLAEVSGSTNLVTACSVNDGGHVVGFMDLKAKGGNEQHAYVLIPNTP